VSPGIHPHWLQRVHGNAVYAHPAPNARTNRIPNDAAERCSICIADSLTDHLANSLADSLTDHLANSLADSLTDHLSDCWTD
jgi:hypothetical protein